MMEEARDIGGLIYEAMKLGLGNASRREATAWLPWALDALLAEEVEQGADAKARMQAAEASKDETESHWGRVGAYMQAAKDAGYLRPIVRQADEDALALLAGGGVGQAAD